MAEPAQEKPLLCPTTGNPITVLLQTPKVSLESPATERLIDACFDKMNSVYKAFKFTDENWAEMVKLSPDATKAICDIERLSLDELTYGDLRKYYELHTNIWKSFHARSNSLSDRFKTITKKP